MSRTVDRLAQARRATNSGKGVVMVERGIIGGTCVNVGCVPSKALLAAAEARHGAAAAGRFAGLVPADFPAPIGGKDALVARLRAEKYTDLAADVAGSVPLMACSVPCARPVPSLW
ncbi:hypothetical protein [Actinomadura sp. 3N407]|uniref:hypothetical protein n=1 Tax=Actinomadura sp. 3N407 TaxID=3457423 RepID=UPI003FCD3B1A